MFHLAVRVLYISPSCLYIRRSCLCRRRSSPCISRSCLCIRCSCLSKNKFADFCLWNVNLFARKTAHGQWAGLTVLRKGLDRLWGRHKALRKLFQLLRIAKTTYGLLFMNCEVGIMFYVALMFCNGKHLLVCGGLFGRGFWLLARRKLRELHR